MAYTGCRAQPLSELQKTVRKKHIAHMLGVEFHVYPNGGSCYYIPLVDLGVPLNEFIEKIKRLDEAVDDGAPPAKW